MLAANPTKQPMRRLEGLRNADSTSGYVFNEVSVSALQDQGKGMVAFLGAVAWRSAQKLKVNDSYGYGSFGSDDGLSQGPE